jgi:predicted Zn-dependent protease
MPLCFHRSLRRLLPTFGLCLVVGVGSTLAPSSTVHAQDLRLPEMGDPSDRLLTPAAESRLGEAFMRSIRSEHRVIDDPLLAGYIEQLGQRLAATGGAASQGFHFFLVDEPAVNAFAGPAGYIGINTGLVLATESESELASVIAHEIAHVTQKHLLRAFDDYKRMNAPAAAVLIAAVVAGLSGAPSDVTGAAIAGVQAGMIQRQINFTRNNEEEADRVGMAILEEAGYDPRGMPLFFERLASRNQTYGSEVPEFLRTHPVTSNRVADSLGRASQYPYRQYPDSLDYHLVRVTLKARQFGEPAQAVRYFHDSLKEGRYRSETAQRYGYALALMDAHMLEPARNEVDRLLDKDPGRVDFLLLDARLYKLAGKTAKGLERLKAALESHPDNYALVLRYAEDLLDAGRSGQAMAMLEEEVQHRSDDARLHRLLARAATTDGQANLGHQHMAEYYYLSGEYEAAIGQLEIALRDRSVEYFRSAQMSARLKKIRKEWAELKEAKSHDP